MPAMSLKDLHEVGDLSLLGVEGEQGQACTGPNGDDHAVHLAARRDPVRAGGEVGAGRTFEVRRGIEGCECLIHHESTQGGVVIRVSCAGENLHDDRLRHADVCTGSDQIAQGRA